MLGTGVENFLEGCQIFCIDLLVVLNCFANFWWGIKAFELHHTF